MPKTKQISLILVISILKLWHGELEMASHSRFLSSDETRFFMDRPSTTEMTVSYLYHLR